MKIDVKLEKGPYGKASVCVFLEREIKIERMAECIFKNDPKAVIYFSPHEWAHMGYDGYAIHADSPIEPILADMENGIVFSIWIEHKDGIIESYTENTKFFYTFVPNEMSEEEVEDYFRKLFGES